MDGTPRPRADGRGGAAISGGEAPTPRRAPPAGLVALGSRLPGFLRPSFGDLVLLALFRLLLAVPPYDTDVWWHLRTGDLILADRAVPRADVFSFTVLGKPWIAHEWLAEVAMALAYRAAGLEAMAVLQAALLVLALAVVYRHLRSDGAALPLYGPLLVVTLILMLPAAHPRPYLLSLVGLAVLLYWLRALADRRWLLLCVPALFVLWANVHAGFSLGLLAMGLVTAGELWRTRRWPVRHLQLLGLAVVACVANPYGIRLLLYPLQYRAGSAHYDLITEWASPDFHQAFSWLVLAFLATAALMLATRKAPGWQADALVLVCFGGLAMMSVRNIPLLAVAASPILARQVSRTGSALRLPRGAAGSAGPGFAGRVLRDMGRLWQAEDRWVGVPITALAAIVLVAGLARGPRDAEAFNPSAWPRSSWWDLPYAAVDDLRSTADAGPLLNDYSWGGYLIWALHPPQPVFIDGRADVYGDEVMRDYADMVGLAPDWRSRLDRYGIRRVLLPPDTPLTQALLLLPEWRVVHQDERSVLFARGGR